MKHTPYGTLFDYIAWRGDLTFAERPFNEVDALVLSVLSYLDYSHVPENAVTFYEEAYQLLCDIPDEEKHDVPLMMADSLMPFGKAVAGCERFRKIGVRHFVNTVDLERQLQFSAVTFMLPDNTAFLSFRGTDNTLVGWKEDFNMSFISSVPAQIEAAQYAQFVLEHLDVPIRAGGHSKGGNLAIWACAHLPDDQKEQIQAIYSNDGPGFREEFFHSKDYASIRDRIHSFVPESSIVGVLMEHDDHTIILSSQKAALQHDPFSWYVLGTTFIHDDDRTKSGQRFDKLLNTWIRNMSMEEREAFVNGVYDIVLSSNARTLSDLDQKKLQSLFLMQKSFREMDKEKQAHVVHGFIKIFINEETMANRKFINKLMDLDIFENKQAWMDFLKRESTAIREHFQKAEKEKLHG